MLSYHTRVTSATAAIIIYANTFKLVFSCILSSDNRPSCLSILRPREYAVVCTYATSRCITAKPVS